MARARGAQAGALGGGEPADTHDLRLILRAASMYHLDGATHAEIARRLGVSRPTAGRLVARAQDRGLVRIVFDVPEHLAASVHTDLEADLEDRFGLDEVALIDDDLDDYRPGALAELGRATAAVVSRRLRPDDTLGFTWGPETVALADSLSGRGTTCHRVVQLDGSLGGQHFRTGVDHIFARLTARLDAEPVRLVAPLYADAATVEALRRDSRIGQALQLGARADLMVFGCGTLGAEATLMRGAFLDPADVERLRVLGATGEVGGEFYDAAGRTVYPELRERTVGVTLDAVRACRTTVLVSGGEARRGGILGALRAGLATVLVTDVETAHWLADQGPGDRADRPAPHSG